MSLILDRPAAPVATTAPAAAAARTAPSGRPLAAPRPTRRRPRRPSCQPPAGRAAAPRRPAPLPEGTEARGFALYVGLDEAQGRRSRHRPRRHRRRRSRRSSPSSPPLPRRTPPSPSPRAAPAAATSTSSASPCRTRRPWPPTARSPRSDEPGARGGVVVDISRKRVLLDGETAALTYKEFELLQYLVLREGRTIERAELDRRRSGRPATTRSRTSAPSTCTCVACARSSAPSRTSSAPCAASATASTATPTSRSATRRPRRPTSSERSSTGLGEANSSEFQENNGSITRRPLPGRYISEASSRLLWRRGRDVIAGHSWCKGRRPVAQRPAFCRPGPPVVTERPRRRDPRVAAPRRNRHPRSPHPGDMRRHRPSRPAYIPGPSSRHSTSREREDVHERDIRGRRRLGVAVPRAGRGDARAERRLPDRRDLVQRVRRAVQPVEPARAAAPASAT